MEDLYKTLGFKQPEYLKNHYGIKIYIGEKGKEDWCVEIPKEIMKKKTSKYNFNTNYVYYLVTEEDALRIAREYTRLASA